MMRLARAGSKEFSFDRLCCGALPHVFISGVFSNYRLYLVPNLAESISLFFIGIAKASVSRLRDPVQSPRVLMGFAHHLIDLSRGAGMIFRWILAL